MSLPNSAPWYRQIARRIAILWPLKAVGTSVFMMLFFWGYFAILKSPFSTPVLMPLTIVDDWVPFSPLAYPVYASLWFYVSLPSALQSGFRVLAWLGVWIAALCLFCLGIFWVLPTAVPVADIDWSLYPQMALIKSLDASGNACPSLHVASAVFSAFWLREIFLAVGAPRWLQWGSVLHCLAILWSTLATRQHVALDVAAGMIVGLLFAVLSLRHVRQLQPTGL